MLYLVYCIIRSRFKTSIRELPKSNQPEIATSTDQLDTSLPDKSTTSITPLHVLSHSPSFPRLPSLNYSLHDRKLTITLFWSLVLLDSVILPISLYFILWYHLPRSTLSANDVFSIVTAAVGGVGVVEYFWRFWKLIRKGSTCRPIGAGRFSVSLSLKDSIQGKAGN
jgi:hypothetical protein